MKVRINKIHFPVTALGPGRRLGIWFQGCSIECPGCVSRDTWHSGTEQETTIEVLLDWSQELTGGVLDGVTISGGEPFEQPEALHGIVEAFGRWPARQRGEMDILVYSGFSLEVVESRHQDILNLVDALITDPFVEKLAPGSRWRGSANQRLSVRTPLGHRRYSDCVSSDRQEPESLQVTVDQRHVWIVGIPRPGDLEKAEIAAAQRGLDLGKVSWRA